MTLIHTIVIVFLFFQVTSIACLSTVLTAGTAKMGLFALPHFPRLRIMMFITVFTVIFTVFCSQHHATMFALSGVFGESVHPSPHHHHRHHHHHPHHQPNYGAPTGGEQNSPGAVLRRLHVWLNQSSGKKQNNLDRIKRCKQSWKMNPIYTVTFRYEFNLSNTMFC